MLPPIDTIDAQRISPVIQIIVGDIGAASLDVV